MVTVQLLFPQLETEQGCIRLSVIEGTEWVTNARKAHYVYLILPVLGAPCNLH